jgi:hypothetical protein
MDERSAAGFRLRLGLDPYLRLILFSLLVGFLLAMFASRGILDAAMIWQRSRAPSGSAFDFGLVNRLIGVIPPLFLLLSVLVPMLCLSLRSQGRARISWDEEGVTEWEGDAVRTFIARADARVASEMKSDVRRYGRRRFEEKLSHVVQISDSAGRRITVAWRAHRFVFLFGSLPSWTRRRAVVTDDATITELLAAYPPRVSQPPIEPDERSARRPFGPLSRSLTALAIVFVLLSIASIGVNKRADEWTGLSLFIAGLLFFALVLRPLGELRAVALTTRRFARARRISFARAPDGSSLVRLEDGRALPCDVSELRHPDARAHQRTAPVHALVDLSESEGSYREAPAYAIVRAIDTDAERAERWRLLVANGLEIASRVAHAALVTTIGALVLLERQRF